MDGDIERNAELLRSGYAAFARGDMAAVQRTWHPDVVWHAQRLGQLSGDHVGWDGFMAFIGRTMELTGGTFRLEVRDVLASPTGAAASVQSIAERPDGRRLNSNQVHLFAVRDGKVAEVWQFVGDVAQADAFWE